MKKFYLINLILSLAGLGLAGWLYKKHQGLERSFFLTFNLPPRLANTRDVERAIQTAITEYDQALTSRLTSHVN